MHHYQSTLVLSGHRYVVLETGEIKEMNTNGTQRTDNLSSIRRTMRKLRRLITANFSGGTDQLWVTLTYADDINSKRISDTQIVYRDFKTFMNKLRLRVKPVEYISILEPQASGRWHMHVLMKTTDESELFIENSLMSDLWGRGFTFTKRLSDKDNVSAYVMSYVTNLKIGEGTSKKYVKGLRLYMYPKGTRIYRRSKGIVDPEVMTTTKEKLTEKFKMGESEKRAFYERSFTTKDGTKVVTQTEFFDRKEILKHDQSNNHKERASSNGLPAQPS